jgi:hypothetical protein
MKRCMTLCLYAALVLVLSTVLVLIFTKRARAIIVGTWRAQVGPEAEHDFYLTFGSDGNYRLRYVRDEEDRVVEEGTYRVLDPIRVELRPSSGPVRLAKYRLDELTDLRVSLICALDRITSQETIFNKVSNSTVLVLFLTKRARAVLVGTWSAHGGPEVEHYLTFGSDGTYRYRYVVLDEVRGREEGTYRVLDPIRVELRPSSGPVRLAKYRLDELTDLRVSLICAPDRKTAQEARFNKVKHQ